MSRKIAIVAIEHPDHDGLYLHGLRADDNTWCIPGGHFESGEDNTEAAKRELFEETGLVADLEQVHDELTTDYQGKPLHIFLFTGKNTSGDLSAVNDPDAEFKEFKYINPESDAYKFRVPKEKNVLLTWIHSQKLSKSMFESDSLAKVEDPPMVRGQVNNNGDVAVNHHQQQNLLVWNHGPAKQKYFQTLVDQHKQDFIGSLPAVNQAAAEKLINKVSKDPARHYIATRNRLGAHDMRLRHLGSLIVGDKASSVLPHPDGTLTISQDRHGSNPQTSSWHIDHKGSMTDVSRQNNFKHPEGAMDFTQSNNRSRFGKDHGIFPAKPEKLSNENIDIKKSLASSTNTLKINYLLTEGSVRIPKEHSNAKRPYNVSNDPGRLSQQTIGVAFEAGRDHDDRGIRIMAGLHAGQLLKSYVVIPMTLNSLAKSDALISFGYRVFATVLYKNNNKVPALLIENPTDFEAIIKHAVTHNCEYVVISSGNKNEILYTKGSHSGKMQVGLSSALQKTEPFFGVKIENDFIEFGETHHLYYSPSPFVVPKS